MKKLLVVSDSFKGTLSSVEICNIAKETVPKVYPECYVDCIPAADGGEGTCACFREAIGAEPVSANVKDLFFRSMDAEYVRKDELAVLEIASVAGLPMAGEAKNPEITTTYGFGELIADAIEKGCTEFLLGLGGSATNDGGCGCAAALGVQFYNDRGESFIPTGETLKDIVGIDTSLADELLDGINVTVMCDVENPLTGPEGAAAIFGPQKGADPEMVKRLDAGLAHLAEVIRHELGLDIANVPGSGAAGGLGAGCMAFLGAELRPGIEAVLDLTDFDQRVRDADLVLTGEGQIDRQSVHGKVLSGILKRTRPKNIPVLAVVGSIGEGADEAYEMGLTAMLSINQRAEPLEASATQSDENYRSVLENILRLTKAAETVRKREVRDEHLRDINAGI